jgi:hypothetical protein
VADEQFWAPILHYTHPAPTNPYPGKQFRAVVLLVQVLAPTPHYQQVLFIVR